MYDSLVINKNMLPLSGEDKDKITGDVVWQTKDLVRQLAEARITDDGELWIKESDFMWDDDEDQDGESDPAADSAKKKRVAERIEHHGFVRFYSDIQDEWFEFKAKFTDGKMVGIERVE